MKCQYLENKIPYKAEIWYLEVAHDADFDCCIEICINRQNWSNHSEDNEDIKMSTLSRAKFGI